MASTDWTPPAVFDDFRIVRLLGSGGMGEVYLAHDMALDRPVALKFVSSLDLDPQRHQRFLAEARAIARLTHPNVVSVHRVGLVDGRPYFVTDYVRGASLAELKRPIPWERALHIGLGLSRGLSAAHRQGILHRDIKPANVMLGDDGEVKLLDFGLAKLLIDEDSTLSYGRPRRADSADTHDPSPARSGESARSGITLPGSVVGTPRYMSPETLSGNPATRRSDIYSLGAVLWELCAGRPHREPDVRAQRTESLPYRIPPRDTPRLEERIPGASPRFAAVVARCLRDDPAERYGTADDVVDALEALQPQARAPILTEGNPYRGLEPFEAEHRAFFFGRDADLRRVLERLRADPFVIVAGDSGVGKSSLCRAGVLPLVVDGGLEDGRRYEVARLVPGSHPVAALATALAPILDQPEAQVAECARDDPQGFARSLRQHGRAGRAFVIFIDQLEELFTLSDPDEAQVMGQVLGHLAVAASPGVRVLCTVRGDFFTRLATLRGVGEEVARALYLLRPLNAEGLREAVVSPALRKGVRFESAALVDELVAASTRAAGGLPLLQFALAELWEARDRDTNLIPVAALERIGGVAGALAGHADGVLARLDVSQQAAARALLVRLVAADGTRLRRTSVELGTEAPAVRIALEALIHGRVVVARETRGEMAYEIAHEALVDGWQTLRDWLDRDAAKRLVRQRLETAAGEWSRLGRSREALWSPRLLVESDNLEPAELRPAEAEFLAASRRAARRRQLTRWAIVTAIPVLLAAAWGGLQLKARSDLERHIAPRMIAARALYEEGRALSADTEPLRRRAYNLFDQVGEAGEPGHPPTAAEAASTAEAAWQEALEEARRSDDALVRASLDAEAALALDPRRQAARDLIADVAYERIVLANRFHLAEDLREIRHRLEAYDADGSRGRRLSEPPQLAIATDPPGARVTIAMYEEEDRRRLGTPADLGTTPIPAAALASGPGSYLIRLSHPGRVAVSDAVLLAAGETLPLELELPEEGRVPRGFVYVPAGRFLFGSAEQEPIRTGFLRAEPLHERRTSGFLIARTEVTISDWIEFLDNLPPGEVSRRTPSVASATGSFELRRDGREWSLVLRRGGRAVTVKQGEPVVYEMRVRRREQNWLRFPVSGISKEDAFAYLRWLSATGRVPGARLCTEVEWERAARGADDRHFPHGNIFDPDDANIDETYGRVVGAFGPDEVGSHPISTSPFGVLDLTGNVMEWTESSRDPAEAVLRGGAWYYDQLSGWTNDRTLVEPLLRDSNTGMRVCASWRERRTG